MGRSAKVHKRVKKTTQPTAVAAAPAQSAKRRAGLKSKTKAKQGEHVLGGADYVTLLLGGRRRAAEEALKLPEDDVD